MLEEEKKTRRWIGIKKKKSPHDKTNISITKQRLTHTFSDSGRQRTVNASSPNTVPLLIVCFIPKGIDWDQLVTDWRRTKLGCIQHHEAFVFVFTHISHMGREQNRVKRFVKERLVPDCLSRVPQQDHFTGVSRQHERKTVANSKHCFHTLYKIIS